jgi:hypothetical protein
MCLTPLLIYGPVVPKRGKYKHLRQSLTVGYFFTSMVELADAVLLLPAIVYLTDNAKITHTIKMVINVCNAIRILRELRSKKCSSIIIIKDAEIIQAANRASVGMLFILAVFNNGNVSFFVCYFPLSGLLAKGIFALAF